MHLTLAQASQLSEATYEFGEVQKQIGRRYRRKGFRAAGRGRLWRHGLREHWPVLRPCYMRYRANRAPWLLAPPRVRRPERYFPHRQKCAAACATQLFDRIALLPAARQSAAPGARPRKPPMPPHCDPDSTCSFHSKRPAVDDPALARSRSQSASPAGGRPHNVNYSMPDRRDAAPRNRALAASYLLPAPAHGGTQNKKVRNTPARHLF